MATMSSAQLISAPSLQAKLGPAGPQVAWAGNCGGWAGGRGLQPATQDRLTPYSPTFCLLSRPLSFSSFGQEALAHPGMFQSEYFVFWLGT